MEYPNWFIASAVNLNFEKHLAGWANGPINALQIGAFTGDATEWLLKNALAHEGSKLIDVDPWLGSNESIHKTFDWSDVEVLYTERHKQDIESGKLVKWKGFSDDFFAQNGELFDFIYVDGDHTAKAVVKDAINSWKVLKSGGVLAFDDYRWTNGGTRDQDPRPAIDAFVLAHKNYLTVLEVNNQYWILKK